MNKIIFVDDDRNLLSAIKRQLRGHYQIALAEGGEDALKIMGEKGPFAVIVADMRMPGMNGIELLAKVHARYPDTVRIMLTGNADMQTAVDAVNKGEIFRFLSKPCDTPDMLKALEAACKQYDLIMAERRVLKETLGSTVKVLGELLSLANPIAFGRASRLRDVMHRLGARLQPDKVWEYEVAGMLSQIGTLTLPAIILEKVQQGKVLDATEQALFDDHPKIGSELVSTIPRMETVSRIVALQEERGGASGGTMSEAEQKRNPLGARALQAAIDFDSLVTAGKKWHEALHEMERVADWYDTQVMEAFRGVIESQVDFVVKEVKIADLQSGMILADDIHSQSGGVVKKAEGQEITRSFKSWLMNYHISLKIQEPIKVRVPVNKSTD